MKRYKKLRTVIPYTSNRSLFHDDHVREPYHSIEIDDPMIEHPNGEWVKWEDVKVLDLTFCEKVIKCFQNELAKKG